MAAIDTDDHGGGGSGALGRFVVPLVLLLALAGLGWAIFLQMGQSGTGPKRQTVKIAVLPDTPPPPPPPPKEEKKPEPKPEDKPQPREQPKPVEAPPQPQQLKMEGAAGDGPSPFGAGTVTTDYTKGAIGTGGGGTLADRMSAINYGNAAKRELNAFLNREEGLRRLGDYQVPIALWLRADGSLERFELQRSSGRDDVDQLLRKTLSRFQGFRAPPPANMAWPMRLQLTNRLTG